MIVDDNLLARNIAWNDIKQEAVKYMDGRFFDENKVYHFHFRIDPSTTGFRRLPNLNNYRIKAFYDVEANRVSGNNIQFEDAIEITSSNNDRSMGDSESLNYGYYVTHGNEFLIPVQSNSFNLNLKLYGANVDKLKQSIETKLKVLYMALFDGNSDDIYKAMNVLKDSYKNITQEFSDNIEVQKKSYGSIKLYKI